MIEIYFIFFKIPKMMAELARQKGRNPVAWGGASIVTYLFVEFGVIIGVFVGYLIAAVTLELPREPPAILNVLAYLLGLGSAIGSVALMHFILKTRNPTANAPQPPPPPYFGQV